MMSYLKAESSDEDCYMVWIASCVAERMLLEHKMLKYLPSTIAASAVYMALKVTHGSAKWTQVRLHGAPCLADLLLLPALPVR